MNRLQPEEQNLLTSTEFLYENSPCGHLSFHPDGKIFRVNKTLLNWIGLNNEEIIEQKKFHDILSVGGKLYYQMVVLPLLNRQGFINEINFDIDLKNGTAFPSLVNAVNIKGDDGKTIAVHASILKITDRKKYESELLRSKQFAEEERKRFESLSNIIPEIIWTALANGNVNFMNERFFEYFACKNETPRKTALLHLIHPQKRKELFRLWIESVKNGEKFEAEVLLKKQFNNYEWFLIRAIPYKNSNDYIETWFGSCTNIHEHKMQQLQAVKNLSNSLSEASEIISSKEKTLEEIAYSQSHLVRRPLANIIGLVEMLETTEESSANNSIVGMLKQSAAELDVMVKDIVLKV
ncbi:PAS domain S-box protein [Mucilaginibacter arboris]|uniref:histidine kinase n=1 Tax=Mucilaginibacter arboris TaxID=2682090 RepID=A0A7K1SYS6_9SPHI|nr:PAS domain S-box protein [Mucilaginibacter arboris]MVN22476.1 PAS domain S-box protein [Mucilaginibacter arboris]